MRTTFKTTILSFGNNAGIEVPNKNIEELSTGKRPPVIVTIGKYSYKSTVGIMNGKNLIPFAKAHRDASGLAPGDMVTIQLELDNGTRDVEIPDELQKALNAEGIKEFFDKLAYSKRKEFSRQVTDAKTEETKTRRILKILETLKKVAM